MKRVLLNAAALALFSLIGVVVGAYLSERMATERELSHLQVDTFLEFNQQYLFRDPELRRIRVKFEAKKSKLLTDDEMDYYLGFFEDVGKFYRRNLIDFDLFDNSLGPYIKELYEDPPTMRYVRKARANDNDPTEYENFEALAVKVEAYDAADVESRMKKDPAATSSQ